MTSNQIRKKFLEFFKDKGHKIVPSSSLVPIDDPSVLLTTAGMQQFKKYYTEPSLAPAPNVASIQKSFRTSDIDEVGDESHLTFFEMLGNFSFGGYFKEGAIKYTKEFLESVGLTIDYVTVFAGDGEMPFDEESYKIWQSLGIKDIRKSGREDNFWGPTGSEGPCGPTTEIYINGVEIWNIVFNEYYCKNGVFEKLKTPGVDTGMGLERLAMVLQNKKNIFETDLFESFIKTLPIYLSDQTKRIIIDHARAVTFLIGDGLLPSNKDAGYILRRLARRYIVRVRGVGDGYFTLFGKIIDYYQDIYSELEREKIFSVFKTELSQFEKTLNIGIHELEKTTFLDGPTAFKLYESYGLPYEVIKDLGGEKAKNLTKEDFDVQFKKHQEISRAGAEQKFGGHGIGTVQDKETAEKMTRLHTATHLLHQALHDVLGGEAEVKQMGSDITEERTRFDFTFPRKLTMEEIEKIENIVNEKIKMNLPVTAKKMRKEEALKLEARAFFKEKYPDEVNVYSVGDPDLTKAYSKEFCDGPHVKNTGEIGIFKIIKEESSSAGVRRLRAVVE